MKPVFARFFRTIDEACAFAENVFDDVKGVMSVPHIEIWPSGTLYILTVRF